MAAFAPAVGQSFRSRPPRNPNNQSSDSPRQLEFGSAMRDFKNMFPDMDDEVIEAVLRANNGLVDATIDQLLSMGAGEEKTNQNTKVFPHLPSYTDTSPTEPPPAYSPRDEESVSSSFERRPLPARPFSNWNPPLLGNLPDDFLRLVGRPSRTTTRTDSSPNSTTLTDRRSDREHEQFLEDEKLAKFLQNEEFVRELKHNSDFMMSLERDKQRNTELNTDVPRDEAPPLASASSNKPSLKTEVHSSSQSQSEPADLSHLGAVGGGGGHSNSGFTHENEDVVLREKLKHMGKNTRKKLDKMARLFQRKKTSQRANLITSGAASTTNLLEEYEDDEDDELLNVMAGGRLEIMNEGEADDDGKRDAEESKDSMQSDDTPHVKRYDPIVFYAEDNEFQYKPEK